MCSGRFDWPGVAMHVSPELAGIAKYDAGKEFYRCASLFRGVLKRE